MFWRTYMGSRYIHVPLCGRYKHANHVFFFTRAKKKTIYMCDFYQQAQPFRLYVHAQFVIACSQGSRARWWPQNLGTGACSLLRTRARWRCVVVLVYLRRRLYCLTLGSLSWFNAALTISLSVIGAQLRMSAVHDWRQHALWYGCSSISYGCH